MNAAKAQSGAAPSPAGLMERVRPELAGKLRHDPSAAECAWFERVLELFRPAVENLDELPARVAFVFGFDPDAARGDAENAAVLEADSARVVLAELGDRTRTFAGRVTPAIFRAWLNEIKLATGTKGEELSQPVRIALMGSCIGPELDKLIPAIEEGVSLGLGIPSVKERVQRFVGV